MLKWYIHGTCTCTLERLFFDLFSDVIGPVTNACGHVSIIYADMATGISIVSIFKGVTGSMTSLNKSKNSLSIKGPVEANGSVANFLSNCIVNTSSAMDILVLPCCQGHGSRGEQEHNKVNHYYFTSNKKIS